MFLLVNIVTPMYNTLIIFLIMDPCFIYSSHFFHLLLEVILHIFTQFHVSWGSFTFNKEVHTFSSIGHILWGTFRLLLHIWTSFIHPTLEILECCLSSTTFEGVFHMIWGWTHKCWVYDIHMDVLVYDLTWRLSFLSSWRTFS